MIKVVQLYECQCDLNPSHKWISRSPEIPKRCAVCKSRRWNSFSAKPESDPAPAHPTERTIEIQITVSCNQRQER